MLSKKIIRNVSWIFIFLFIYQWCGVKTIYAVDTSVVVEINSTILGSTKINSFINSKISEGYTKFYIEDGQPYQLDDSIIINKPNIEIKGESNTGTILFLKSDSDIDGIVNAHGIVIESDNIELSNFQFDASLGKDAFRAEKDQNVNNVNISNCIIKKSAGNSAISFLNETTTKSLNNSIVDNNITTDEPATAEDAIIFKNQKDGNITNNTVEGGRVTIRLCENIEVENNTITKSKEAGIMATVPLKDIKISNNTIEQTTKAAIVVVEENTVDDDNLRYDGVEISGNYISDSKYFGIEVRNLKNALISNNTISGIDYHGIYLLHSDNATVSDNIISDYAKGVNNSDWSDKSAGIFLDYAVIDTKIMSNTINNNKLYAIRVHDWENNTNNTICSDNIINGSFDECIHAKIGSPQYTNILEKDTVTENSISIKWIEMNPGVNYKINIDGSKIVDVGENETYLDTGLESDTEHTYQISLDGNNWSNEIKIKTLSSLPPPISVIIPQNLRIAATTESSIQIVWDEVNSTTEYEVEADGIIVSVGTNESYDHTGLLSISNHTYRVRIKDGEWSGYIYGATLDSKTQEDIIPQNLRVVATTESSIQITWDEVDSTTEYEVEADGVTVSVGKDESYEDSGLLSGTTHKYRVRIKEGKWSEYIFANTLDSQTPGVLIPQNIRAKSTKNTITINWDEIDKSTEYEIEVDGEIISVGISEKFKHKSLKSNSKHRYRVRIKGGEWSSVLIARTSKNMSSSKETNNSNNNNDNDEYDRVEIYFGNRRNFVYENQPIGNVQVDMLNRIFFCKFEENYYLGIRAWKNNELKIEKEYKLNLPQGKNLEFNTIDNKFNGISNEIKEIMIQDNGEHLFYVNDLENITLSKCILVGGYVISIDRIKIKNNIL